MFNGIQRLRQADLAIEVTADPDMHRPVRFVLGLPRVAVVRSEHLLEGVVLLASGPRVCPQRTTDQRKKNEKMRKWENGKMRK